MIGEVGYALAKEGFEYCVKMIDSKLWYVAAVYCNSIMAGVLGKKNPYDVRLDCEVGAVCGVRLNIEHTCTLQHSRMTRYC